MVSKGVRGEASLSKSQAVTCDNWNCYKYLFSNYKAKYWCSISFKYLLSYHAPFGGSAINCMTNIELDHSNLLKVIKNSYLKTKQNKSIPLKETPNPRDICSLDRACLCWRRRATDPACTYIRLPQATYSTVLRVGHFYHKFNKTQLWLVPALTDYSDRRTACILLNLQDLHQIFPAIQKAKQFQYKTRKHFQHFFKCVQGLLLHMSY